MAFAIVASMGWIALAWPWAALALVEGWAPRTEAIAYLAALTIVLGIAVLAVVLAASPEMQRRRRERRNGLR